MKLYNYDNLLKAIREIQTSKTIAENERTMNNKNKLLRMENELKLSGLLDDWYDLKRLCKEFNIRIMPYGGWDEDRRGALINDYEYFRDSGIFAKCMSSGSHWSDYFGFSYKDKEFKWVTVHATKSTSFNGFDDEDYEIYTKINLIETFMKTYEEYRNIQLQRLYTKMGKTIEEIVDIKSGGF